MNPPSKANLFILNNITHIACPARGLSIYIHYAPRGTATARNLIQNEWYHITNVASLLLPCVSRYAAVAKNSHCTQSYSKYICIISRTLTAPRRDLSIGIHCAPRGTATARNLIQNELIHIAHIASLLLPCVSRYAAVAKNSHCTQSIQNIVVSYHAHCLPRVGLEYRRI